MPRSKPPGPARCLTPAQIRYAVRAHALHQKTTHKAVATKFGVSVSAVRNSIYRDQREKELAAMRHDPDTCLGGTSCPRCA